MSLKLPAEIVEMTTVTKDTVGVLDAWAKTVDETINVAFSEYRCAPPRRVTGKHRGKSIEQLRDEDPGPPCITVSTVEKLSEQRVMRRVHLHTSKHTFSTATNARIELALLLDEQAKLRKDHLPTDAELNSPEPWEYEDDLAKHHSLTGTLCKESVANAKYVENDVRIADLLDIIKGDWHESFLQVVSMMKQKATASEFSPRGRQKLLKQAAERKAAAGATSAK